MSDFQTQRAEAIRAEVSHYSGDLLPGAVDQVVEAVSRRPIEGVPGKVARAVAEFVESPLAERFRKLDYQPPADKLRAAIERRAADLKPGAVDEIYSRLAVSHARRPVGDIAEAVDRHLSSPDANEFRKEPAPPNWLVANVRKALEPFESQLAPGAAETLAERWGPVLGTLDARNIRMQVESRLKSGVYDGHLRGEFDPSKAERPTRTPSHEPVSRSSDGSSRVSRSEDAPPPYRFR